MNKSIDDKIKLMNNILDMFYVMQHVTELMNKLVTI